MKKNIFTIVVALLTFLSPVKAREVYFFDSAKTEPNREIQEPTRNVYFYDKENNLEKELQEKKEAVAVSTERKVYLFEEKNNQNITKEQDLIAVQNNKLLKAELITRQTKFKTLLRNVLEKYVSESTQPISESMELKLASLNQSIKPRNVYWFEEDGSISTAREVIVDKSFEQITELPDVFKTASFKANESIGAFLYVDNLL